MRFSLGEERTAFAAAVRAALTDGCPPSVVRDAWEGKSLDRGIWHTLVEMGTTDPDLDFVTRVVVAEEVGRAALPHPWMETAFVAGPLLGDELGAQLVSTDLGTPGRFPCGADADILLIANIVEPGRARRLDVADPSSSSGRAASVAIVAAPTVTATPVESMDLARRLVAVTAMPDSTTVAHVEGPNTRVAGTLGTAALLLGLGQHLLDTTVTYVSERHQFGQPVGGFQAVKHHLADVAKDLAFARPVVWRAAHRLDTAHHDAARDASMAKALASDAATLAAEAALQCHGAIGYTVEYDLHLWLKRVWALARAWGDATAHRAQVAQHLGLIGSSS